MRNKGHFISSILKSGLRIMAIVAGLYALKISMNNAFIVTSVGLLVAELFGIIEEFLDKR